MHISKKIQGTRKKAPPRLTLNQRKAKRLAWDAWLERRDEIVHELLSSPKRRLNKSDIYRIQRECESFGLTADEIFEFVCGVSERIAVRTYSDIRNSTNRLKELTKTHRFVYAYRLNDEGENDYQVQEAN